MRNFVTGRSFEDMKFSMRISPQPSVAYPGILFGEGGVQQIQLRAEDREKGDLGAVAP
jgi:hypothetical protein